MRLNRKLLRVSLLMPALSLLASGCGGFSATKSVSPASFFLPGLIKADPPVAPPTETLPAVRPGDKVVQS